MMILNKIGKTLLIYILITSLLITKNEVSYIISTLIGFYLIKKFYKDIKINKEKPNIKDIVIYGFIIIGVSTFGSLISIMINNLISLFGYTFLNQKTKIFEFNNPYQAIMISIYVLIIAPIVEEFIFRGYILETLKKYNTIIALVLSAIIFALFHMEYYQLIPAFMCGLVLGTIYIKYNSIYLVIGAHMINNIISLISTQVNFNYGYIFIIIGAILLLNNKDKLKIEQIKNNDFKYAYIYKSLSCLIFILLSLLIIFLNFKAI